MYEPKERLIFTQVTGRESECEFLFKGMVPGCVVVLFLDAQGRPTSHDGQTVPLKQLRRK